MLDRHAVQKLLDAGVKPRAQWPSSLACRGVRSSESRTRPRFGVAPNCMLRRVGEQPERPRGSPAGSPTRWGRACRRSCSTTRSVRRVRFLDYCEPTARRLA